MLPIYDEINVRGHVSIVQLKDLADQNSLLLTYYDSKAKFVHLRPLKSRGVPEIAMELAKIFVVFGAPNILQSDERRDFLLKVIQKINTLWPECKIIHGKTHVEHKGKGHEYVMKSMLQSWVKKNGKENWEFGCYFVQMQINSLMNEVLGCSPHYGLFGSELRTGLANSGLSPKDIELLVAEEDLEGLYGLRHEVKKEADPQIVEVLVDLPTSSHRLRTGHDVLSSGRFLFNKRLVFSGIQIGLSLLTRRHDKEPRLGWLLLFR